MKVFIKIKLGFLLALLEKIKRINLSWKRTVFLFIPPLIFILVAYPPFSKYRLELKTDAEIFVSRYDMHSNLSTGFAFKIFNFPIGLPWYKMCLENKKFLTIQGQVVDKDYVENNPQISGKVSVPISIKKEPEVRKETLVTGPEETSCITVSGDVEGIEYRIDKYRIETGRAGELFAKGEPLGDKKYGLNMRFEFEKLDLYLKNHYFAWLFKYAVSIVGWFGLFSLLGHIRKYLTSPRIK